MLIKCFSSSPNSYIFSFRKLIINKEHINYIREGSVTKQEIGIVIKKIPNKSSGQV